MEDGRLVGEVLDASGSVVPGATVTVTNQATNAIRSVKTNEAGLYSFPSLVPSQYRVRVELQGFKAVTRSDIELQVQQSARIDFRLEVGSVTEAVEVKSDAALLATEDATVGTVIENAIGGLGADTLIAFAVAILQDADIFPKRDMQLATIETKHQIGNAASDGYQA